MSKKLIDRPVSELNELLSKDESELLESIGVSTLAELGEWSASELSLFTENDYAILSLQKHLKSHKRTLIDFKVFKKSFDEKKKKEFKDKEESNRRAMMSDGTGVGIVGGIGLILLMIYPGYPMVVVILWAAFIIVIGSIISPFLFLKELPNKVSVLWGKGKILVSFKFIFEFCFSVGISVLFLYLIWRQID
jgi:hypothetical protein